MLAVASLRGGGEYGRAWHDAGKLANKQNVFDDFCACARWLVSPGWSRADRIAINGGSNGGLLVGACLTQHPELFGAAVADHAGGKSLSSGPQ
jgi:prolyl oligopeptidase